MTMSTIDMVAAERMIISCYERDEPLFLIGSPGMGKTALYNATAKKLGIGYIPNILSQKDPVDVGGMRVPDEKTGILRHYPPEDLPTELAVRTRRFPEKGIIHYDEINAVAMLMQTTAYGIINERRVGLHHLAPGWVPMASGNQVSDRSAAQRLSLALANRFNIQVVVPDHVSWLKQYASEHVDTRGCAYIRFRGAEVFHVMPKDPNEVRFPSARSWTKAFKFIDEEPTFRRKMFAGYVSDTYADDFEAFWRIMEKATTFDQILADPAKARLPEPTDAGTYYAVVGMVSRLLDRKNIDRVMTYIERMLPDYQVYIMQDATRRETSLKNTSAYGKWCAAHQNVTL